MSQTTHPQLQRNLGTFAAIMLGLGAMIGTGVCVSIGIAAGVAGPAVILAVGLAALVAICNGLSSAQLAASHPVSGGSYEYGYRYLNPALGFTAGWMFLIAKSASAATAALGFAGYVLHALSFSSDHLIPLALGAVVLLTLVVMGGMRRSHFANLGIVTITLLALLVFVAAGVPQITVTNFTPVFPSENSFAAVLQATALMFVAYTGYGRIATLGEEVRRPRRTIPRAIIATMVITALLYMAVATVSIGVLGAGEFHAATAGDAAPLAVVAERFALPYTPQWLAVGAITAMLGVLLNLLLGLSRMLLAMARRGDMPAVFTQLNTARTTPNRSILAMALLISALVLIGDVRLTWSFSAFTVLVYYAITNLAALRLPAEQQLYPRWIAALGLAACLFLAVWVDVYTLLIGLALIGTGLVWHRIAAC
ncbi:MAG: APC family permease [Cellvibrionaceae bacterium]